MSNFGIEGFHDDGVHQLVSKVEKSSPFQEKLREQLMAAAEREIAERRFQMLQFGLDPDDPRAVDEWMQTQPPETEEGIEKDYSQDAFEFGQVIGVKVEGVQANSDVKTPPLFPAKFMETNGPFGRGVF